MSQASRPSEILSCRLFSSLIFRSPPPVRASRVRRRPRGPAPPRPPRRRTGTEGRADRRSCTPGPLASLGRTCAASLPWALGARVAESAPARSVARRWPSDRGSWRGAGRRSSPPIRRCLDQADDDRLDVALLSNCPLTQLLCKLATEFKREDKPHVFWDGR